MKKILFGLLLFSSFVNAQNKRPGDSRGSETMFQGIPYYDGVPTSYRDSQFLAFKSLKDTSAALRLLIGGGGGGGLANGRANWYVMYNTATTDKIGAIQDTLSAIYVHRKNVYHNIPGNVNQIWFYSAHDESAHATYIKGFNPYTGNGWEIRHDSTTNQTRIIQNGSNPDLVFSGGRNVQFNNSGTLTVTNSIITAGISSSALITASLSGGNGMSVVSTSASSYAGQEWKNQGNEITEIRVAGSTYGAYPSRTSHWFVQALNGQNIYLYGASALQKTYIAGLAAGDLQRTDGVGYVLYKAGMYLNYGTTSGSSGYGDRDNSGVKEFKHSGGSWSPYAGTSIVNTFTANQIFNGTGSSITASGGTSAFVGSGSNFGIESTSPGVAYLGSSSSTSNGVALVGVFQRTGSYTAAAGDGVGFRFASKTSTGVSKDFAEIHAVLSTVTNGAEVGALQLRLVNGGGTANLTTQFFGNGSLGIYDGSAPGASLASGVLLYSSSGELIVRDAAGNTTTLSPHTDKYLPGGLSEKLAWSYTSQRDGEYISVDMLRALRILEKLSGEKLVYQGMVRDFEKFKLPNK